MLSQKAIMSAHSKFQEAQTRFDGDNDLNQEHDEEGDLSQDARNLSEVSDRDHRANSTCCYVSRGLAERENLNNGIEGIYLRNLSSRLVMALSEHNDQRFGTQPFPDVANFNARGTTSENEQQRNLSRQRETTRSVARINSHTSPVQVVASGHSFPSSCSMLELVQSCRRKQGPTSRSEYEEAREAKNLGDYVWKKGGHDLSFALITESSEWTAFCQKMLQTGYFTALDGRFVIIDDTLVVRTHFPTITFRGKS